MPVICPLLLIAIKQSENIITDPEKIWAQCLKEKCAWYVIHEIPNAEGCAIAELSNNLKTISLRIEELSMKK